MTETLTRPRVPFAAHAMVEILAPGRTRIPDALELTNHIGSVHAGALFTVAETASGGAMVAAFGDLLAAGARPLVRRSEIRYLRVARGAIVAQASPAEPVEAVRARYAQAGKADFQLAVALADADGQTVAEMDVTWTLKAAG
jgi:acyl-coenzyme A thioesterase PaaI-like protein